MTIAFWISVACLTFTSVMWWRIARRWERSARRWEGIAMHWEMLHGNGIRKLARPIVVPVRQSIFATGITDEES
jgi:hypothetical protein